MVSAIVNRMRVLRMGGEEAPTSVKSRQERRAELNARHMAQDQHRLIQRTRPVRRREPASPLSPYDDGGSLESERLMLARQASEERQRQRDQALLDDPDFDDEQQGFPPSSSESGLGVEPETDAQRAEGVVDEFEGSLRQGRYQRQDTPRPESPELDEALWGPDGPPVDEEATEEARQAGVREMWADWANMHVEHFREGTMTWEELVDELQSNFPE